MMMKKTFRWIQQDKFFSVNIKSFVIAFMSTFIMISSNAASTTVKTYMRDKNSYFVLDASKDNFLNMNPLGSIANAIFGIHKGIIKYVSLLIEQSYTFDLYQLIEKQFNILFEPIKNTFWNGFFPIAGGIFILSLLLLITFQGRASTAFEGFVKGMAVITFALWFMRSPADSMNGIKDITDGVNAELVKNTYSQVKVEDQYKELSDQFYTTFVVEIWRLLNFGPSGFDNEDIKSIRDKYEDKLLKAAPGSEERDRLTEELRSEVKISEDVWIGNLVLVMILSLPDIVIMLLLSGINMASDVFTIGLALIGPIIFLFALLPNYGSRLLMSWMSKIFFFFAITVVTTILLTYYIGFTNILITNRASLGGIVGVFVMKDAIMIAAYIFRDKFIFAAQSVTKGRRGMEQGMEQISFRKEALEGKNKIIDKTKSGLGKGKDALIQTTQKYIRNSDDKRLKARQDAIITPLPMSDDERNKLAEEALEARLQYRISEAENEAVEKEEKFGIRFEPNYGDMEEQVKKYKAGEDPFSGAERRKMVSDIEKHEKVYGDPKEFIDKYKVDFTRMNSEQRISFSKEYLMKRYEENKLNALNESNLSGEPIKYDDWTRERVEREERGEAIFTDKEIKTFSENVRRAEKSGENVRESLYDKTRKSTDKIQPEDHNVNVNHNHVHEHLVRSATEESAISQEQIDIRVVRKPQEEESRLNSNNNKTNEVDLNYKKATEGLTRSVNEIIKNQQEEKRDIDETQEQIKDVQKIIEKKERAINLKVNRLEGEKSEEKEQENN